jgi:hypothetical protein
MSRKAIPAGPSVAIPEPIRGTEPGTWAEHTMRRRLPDILRHVVEVNDFDPGMRERLLRLANSLPWGEIPELGEPYAPDAQSWQDYIRPYRGMNWLQVPWFFGETYFYRRILAELRYYSPESPYFGFDPFHIQKSRALDQSRDAIQELITRVNRWQAGIEDRKAVLGEVLSIDLWGNQGDLSNLPAARDEGWEGSAVWAETSRGLVVDERDEALNYIFGDYSPGRRIDMVLDNVGLELISDLCLADLLLAYELADQILLHLKPHPILVSDATQPDFEATIRWLLREGSAEMRDFGGRLSGHLQKSRMRVEDEFYWSSPLSLWEMPENLRALLGRSQLVVFKGDLNYRRILGDRHWPFTTPFEDVIGHFPSAALALRTAKAELACGLEAGQANALVEADPDWLTDGEWGMIQFWAPP